MFTGLIKDIGKIIKVTPNTEGAALIIESKKLICEIGIDDSVAVNGTCLTATKVQGNQFSVQAVHVTLEKTTTGKLKPGSVVNLELALRANDRLGGHFVQGHVNTVGRITDIKKIGKNTIYTTELDKNYEKYLINEGSIALDGISLTISHLKNNKFSVSIIPHTIDNTILYTKKIGDSVNIEVDVMAKYIEKMLFANANMNEIYEKLGPIKLED
jgi:riboflavin synthase